VTALPVSSVSAIHALGYALQENHAELLATRLLEAQQVAGALTKYVDLRHGALV
jgi:hypothetical protein